MKSAFALFLLFASASCLKMGKPSNRLRAMTFNIWNSGANVKDGIAKIAKQITTADPDVVALQEVEEGKFAQILAALGPQWHGEQRNASTDINEPQPIPRPFKGGNHGCPCPPPPPNFYPDTGIVSKHPIWAESYAATGYGMSIKIKFPTSEATYMNVSVWSMHLDWRNQGSYAACNKLCTDEASLAAGEYALGPEEVGRVSRVGNIRNLIAHPVFQQQLEQTEKEPLLVLGDFNCASHLDWVESTRQEHCGWAFEWPATKILEGETGLRDAFREIYPDPKLDPGNTWAAALKWWEPCPGFTFGYTIPEPQDRIDMIHYKGGLQAVRAAVFEGAGVLRPEPYHQDNDWPSDHSSVVADFEII